MYFLPRWADWGANSRLNLTLAIVEQGTLSIDDYYENTGDYAYFEGHYYLDKAPGPSFLAVPVYAAAYPILNMEPVQNILTRVAESGAFSGTLNEEGTGLLPEKIYDFLVLYWVTVVVIFNSLRCSGGDDFLISAGIGPQQKLERGSGIDLRLGYQCVRVCRQF